MPLRHYLLISLAFLVPAAGCGDTDLPRWAWERPEPLSGCPQSPSEFHEPPLDDVPPQPQLEELINQTRTDILGDTCFQQQDTANCDWGEFPFVPSQQFAMSKNTGEAILIVDEFPKLTPSTIRYSNRIKGFFRVDGEGMIRPVQSSWRVPTKLFHALQLFASPDFIPAEALRKLSGPLKTVYGRTNDGSIGHGNNVFSLLVEANPHQPIVLLDAVSFHQFAREELCDSSGTPESIELLRMKSQRVADGLRQVMKKMDVRFVNLSAGQTLESLKLDWVRHCSGARPSDDILREKLNAYSPIADVLFNTPGVFTAHAAINTSSVADNPFDFPSSKYPNRLRTGYFTALRSGIDDTGRGDHSSLEGWPERRSVDIYLNSGVLPVRPFPYNRTSLLQVDSFGVNIFPILDTTTSWIAPLALSRFIHVRYSRFHDREMSNELIRSIQAVMVPSTCTDLPGNDCVYQDPLLYGQIEAVRLGYRPREYVEP